MKFMFNAPNHLEPRVNALRERDINKILCDVFIYNTKRVFGGIIQRRIP